MRTTALLCLLGLAICQLQAQKPQSTSTAQSFITFIAADACGNDLSNQYLLFGTGPSAHNFSSAPPQIQATCSASGSIGSITGYSGNAALVQQMNNFVGPCANPVFVNLMGAPYYGIAPAGAMVLIFVGNNPNLSTLGGSNAFGGLCGSNIYVAFGNYAGAKPLFPTKQTYDPACGTYVQVSATMGTATQNFIYDPASVAGGDGAYLGVDPGNVVRYGMAANCSAPGLICPPAPVITFSGDLSICEGERTLITATAPTGYGYVWSMGSTARTAEVGPTQTTDYTVTVTNIAQPQCVTAATVAVEVFKLPDVVLKAVHKNTQQTSFCYRDPISLQYALQPVANQSFTLEWYGPNGNFANPNIDQIDEHSAGVYKAHFLFANGCVLEKPLQVSYPVSAPVKICTNAPICPNEELHLEASFFPVLQDGQYRWSGPNFDKEGASVVGLGVQAGQYSVTVTDDNGCTSTGSVYVAVNLCTDEVGSLGDFAWNDFDRDGQQDTGEPGLSGVTVKLYADADGNGVPDGTPIETVTTTLDGLYHFLDLFPGKYLIEFVPPAGFSISPRDVGMDDKDSDLNPTNGRTNSITVAPSSTTPTIDAGFYIPPARMGDWVWEDMNRNGWQDAGEPGIGGVTVKLYADANSDGNPDGAALAQTVSQSSGAYEFVNLPPANYLLEFLPPTGWFASIRNNNAPKDSGDSDIDELNLRTTTIQLVSSENDASNDAGFYRPATLGNFVWNDANHNGRQDIGEPGLSGTSVAVFADANGDGIADGPAIMNTLSNTGGNYTLGGLKPGQYILGFTPATIQTPTIANQGTDEGDSDMDPVTGKTGGITLVSNQSNQTVDAGFYTPQVVLGGRIWEDMNRNGYQDAGEPSITGVTVRLYADANADGLPEGSPLFTANTNTIGNYTFTDAAPGRFVIEFVGPSGYNATLPDTGSDDDDSDVNPATGRTSTIDATTIFVHQSIDAGYTRPANLGNFAWSDQNRNGQQDAGEPGLEGIVIRLYEDANENALPDGPAVATTTTNSLGTYMFNGILPGKYLVEFIATSAYAPTLANQGGDATDSDVDPATGRTATITLLSNQTNHTIDAGFSTAATAGNFVWEDLNYNGIQDAGEPGIEGVSILLFADADANGFPDGAAIASTNTNSNGSYQFSNIAPGNYLFEYNKPGYTPTKKLNTTNKDENDSDMFPHNRRTGTIPLSAGENDHTNDAGFYRLAFIGNFVWRDLNADGHQDPNEPGIDGVTVHIYNDQNNDGIPEGGPLQSITTNNGAYTFYANPGKYILEFLKPSGFVPVAPNQGPDEFDSDANISTGRTATISVTSGMAEYSVDAGFAPSSILGGIVWEDMDVDGWQDPTEPRLGGVTVHLFKDSNADGQPDSPTPMATMTSNGLGEYQFNYLVSDYYLIRFVLPSTLHRATKSHNNANKDFLDSDLPTDGMAQIAAIPLFVGEADLSNSAGLVRLINISGVVWKEISPDGQRSLSPPIEPAHTGVTISLIPDANGDGIPDNSGHATVISNSSTFQNYAFNGHYPRPCWLRFTAPAGYTFTLQDQGSDLTDSDVDPTTGFTEFFPAQSGLSINSIFAGLKLLSLRPSPATINNAETSSTLTNRGEIKVYPNPAGQYFVLEIPADWGECQVEVFDALARQIYFMSVDMKTIVRTDDWPSGTYVVRAISKTSGPQQTAWKRVIIRQK